MRTTGKITDKRYGCSHCGKVSVVSTNHYGEIYSPCNACSWRRPCEATVKVCIDPLPEGWAEPKPWKIVKLGDLAEVK